MLAVYLLRLEQEVHEGQIAEGLNIGELPADRPRDRDAHRLGVQRRQRHGGRAGHVGGHADWNEAGWGSVCSVAFIQVSSPFRLRIRLTNGAGHSVSTTIRLRRRERADPERRAPLKRTLSPVSNCHSRPSIDALSVAADRLLHASLRKTLSMCVRTVEGLMQRWAAASLLLSP